jgi:hypothetical protein
MTELAHVRASVRDYLNRGSRERAQLRSTLESITTCIPETVIFGGMLREFGWGNARKFSSDIDLVANATRHEIYAAIREFSPVENKFGGYRFIAGKRLFDIWALEDTWAFKQRLVVGNGFNALFATTFFGVDAAIFHLKTEQYHFSESHVQGLKERILELNLRENPAPERMMQRAIRTAINGGIGIGPLLANYIIENYRRDRAHTTQYSFVSALEAHVYASSNEPFRFRPQTAAIPG